MTVSTSSDNQTPVRLPRYATADRPAAATAGLLHFLTDGNRGVYYDNGTEFVEVGGAWVRPEYFGARGDVSGLSGCSMTSGSATLTTSGAEFTAADVGKRVVVVGAGTSSASLATTVSSYTSTTEVTLADAASTTVSGVTGWMGTDDTAAIQAALDTGRPVWLNGSYGATTLRLSTAFHLIGPGMIRGGLFRLGAGDGGAFIAMKSGQSAQKGSITDLYVECCGIGTALNGIDLGDETPGTTDVALGTILQNILVRDATGWNIDLYCNVATVVNCWAQTEPSTFTSAQIGSSAAGMRFSNTIAYTYSTAAEGYLPGGAYYLGAGAGSTYTGLHSESSGTASTDIVTVAGSVQTIIGLSATGSSQLCVIRIRSTTDYVSIYNAYASGSGNTLLLDDDRRGITVPHSSTAPITQYLADNSGLATMIRAGELYVPKTSTTPSGTPLGLPTTSNPGMVPFRVLDDGAGTRRLYVYASGGWRYVALS